MLKYWRTLPNPEAPESRPSFRPQQVDLIRHTPKEKWQTRADIPRSEQLSRGTRARAVEFRKGHGKEPKEARRKWC